MVINELEVYLMESLKLGNHTEDPCGEGYLDRISSLPDELLGHMLSFLPTRLAVRTSILSTRWRYMFTLTSCLSFDDEPCFGSPYGFRQIDKARKRSFREFVYNVLKLHRISPIKKFSLVCGGAYDKSDLTAWVSNAVQKGVQEIHYEVADMVDVPDCLVMSETLVSLKIISEGSYDTEIPLSVWLPNLKILHLTYVGFVDCDSMQRMFSGCKVLEELTLDRCYCLASNTGDHVIIFARLLKVLIIENCSFVKGLFEIDAPNLAYLRYNRNFGIKIAPTWKYCRSLVKAELTFDYCAEISDYSFPEYLYDREIFKAAAYKTTKLCLLGRSVEGIILTLGNDQEQMPDFHCLSRLHLCNFPYDSWKYVTSLLDKSPQLETVVFEWGLHRCGLDPASPSCEPIFPFSCHAQVIEVRSFCGHKGSLLHLEHLLKNARVLKKLILHKCRYTSNLELELQFLQLRKNDLLMLPRASRDCCIELK